jgi:hypothetical protein
MDELRRMEDLLASRAIEQLPVERIEQLLVEELIASRTALVPFFKAAPVRARWLQLRRVLSAALRLQAHARGGCVARNIGVVIKQRASLSLAAAGTAAAELYLHGSQAAHVQEAAGERVLRQLAREGRHPASPAATGSAGTSQPAHVNDSHLNDSHQKRKVGADAPLPFAPAASIVAREVCGGRGAGLSGASAIRRQAQARAQSPNKPTAGSSAYDTPSGNRHQIRFTADALFARAASAAPAVPAQPLPASPTAIMMQRARAARTHMPVYSPPPLSPPTEARHVGNILMTTAAATLMSRAAAPACSVQSGQQLSPSVIWVEASGSGTPSAGTARPPARAEEQELHRSEGGWPQLRGALEASLRADDGALVTAEGERARHGALEQEIALMQVGCWRTGHVMMHRS